MSWFAESDAAASVVSVESSPGHHRRTRHTFHYPALATELLAHLDELRRCDELCDVTLIARSSFSDEPECEADSVHEEVDRDREGDFKIRAHRVVLASCSPYFAAMFNSRWAGAKQDKVVINDMDGATLLLLVEYMYTGRIELAEHTVQQILPTAAILQLTAVKDACARFLLDRLDPTNCIGMRAFASRHACAQLETAARRFTRQHFRDLVVSDELLALSERDLLDLISDDRLSAGGEESVFEAVVNWVRYDPDDRRKVLPRLLSEVRLPLLEKCFLVERVCEEPLVQADERCKDLLIDAFKWHIVGSCGGVGVGSTLAGSSRAPHSPVRTAAGSRWSQPRRPLPLNQLVMLVGGQAPKAVADVDTLDTESLQWNALASLPSRRCRSGVAVCGEAVFAIGGFNGAQRVKSVDIYDPRRDQWTAGPSMDLRRSTLGVAVLDGVLVAVGGFDGSSGLSTAEMFDPRQGHWSPIASMSVRRSSVGVCAMGGVIYAIGGYDGHNRQCLNTVEIYDLKANAWRAGPMLNEVRSGAGVTVCGERVVVAGGHEGPVVRQSVEVLTDDGWQLAPSMLLPRRNAGFVNVNGVLYAIGGDDGVSNLACVESLRLGVEHEWRRVDITLPHARSYSGLALLSKQ